VPPGVSFDVCVFFRIFLSTSQYTKDRKSLQKILQRRRFPIDE
jgi:hypothetical protein